MTLKQETVLYEMNDNVATITLNRPQVKNALNFAMHDELFAAFNEANHDNNVKVIILRGSGDAFSAGADLKSFSLEDRENIDYGHYLRETYNRLILFISDIPKPIIAYLNGTAVGAGLSIALACDFRVASYDARVALSFLKIGLVPDAGASYFLPRLVGLGKAMELALGESLTAEEAYRINLINKIGSPDELAASLANTPAEAYGWMKQNMKEGFEKSLAEVLEMEVTAQSKAGSSEEHLAALQQFLGRSTH
ncbi:2-(1,2-epoxy-1,2-dihydrophenyl)acetyl-CoA isomerase [Geomicrobium halophilum]|uniref:2-(1,2-epoxy-1,2-dihydrophenyl)acetyl-CoA isomerase n=1 Tax=Geomicrobium halophilum TaxID=549000 RepID=A0A841PRW4_9BACL|nr:enoyl-CoA hydratase/isomerase family protein [Geomicrobium halophilum]MBB6450544.1 2-(1,2-epoxy-1,2-dihydrophenyl)acetyl-CoA isomerase [Geomicrobium halophilum]